MLCAKAMTHLNISPFDHNFTLFSKEERVKAQMIDTQIHPSLARDTISPIAAGVVWKAIESQAIIDANKLQVSHDLTYN